MARAAPRTLGAFALSAMLTLCGGAARAQASVVVIAHPGLVLETDDVADIYAGDKQLARSVRLVPVDNAEQQANFLAACLKIELARYRSAWTRKTFRDGVPAPALRATDADVADFVRRVPGAVGYVRASAPNGVVVVATCP